MKINPKSMIGLVFTVALVFYIILELISSHADVLSKISQMDWINIFIPILLGVMMLFSSAASYAILASNSNTHAKKRLAIASTYLVAQIVKYIPGRLWGIAYQIKATSALVGTTEAISASITHMLATSLLTIIMLGLALNEMKNWPIAILGVFIITIWIHRGGVHRYWIEYKKHKLINLNPRVINTALVLIFLFLEWLFYLTTWSSLSASSVFNLSQNEIFIVALIYAGAWIISSLASVTPGGLGLREGAFVVLTGGLGFNTGDMITLAILCRIIFTIAEILSGMAGAFLLIFKRPS